MPGVQNTKEPVGRHVPKYASRGDGSKAEKETQLEQMI